MALHLYHFMISTLYLVLLIAFQLWYLTSRQVKHTNLKGYELLMIKEAQKSRMMGGILFFMVTVAFVFQFGWMSGICASIVGLMGVGCLVVMLAPFKYLNIKLLIVFYIFSVTLEIFI